MNKASRVQNKSHTTQIVRSVGLLKHLMSTINRRKKDDSSSKNQFV